MFKTFLSALFIISISALLLGLTFNYVSAQVVDDFETYSLGSDLNGQNNWHMGTNHYATTTITMSDFYTGQFSAKITPSSVLIGATSKSSFIERHFATTTIGTQCIAFKVQNNDYCLDGVCSTANITFSDDVTNSLSAILMDDYIRLQTATSSNNYETWLYLVHEWNYLCLTWNSDTNIWQWQFNNHISNGYRSSLNALNTISTTLGMTDANTNTDYVLFDTLNGTTTTEQTETEIIDLPVDIDTIDVFDDDNPIQIYTKYCFYSDSTCAVDFKFHPDLDGSQIYISEIDGDLFLGSTTIAIKHSDMLNLGSGAYINRIELENPDPPVEQNKQYEIYYQKSGWYKTDPFIIEWYTATSSRALALIDQDTTIEYCQDFVDNTIYTCTEESNFFTCPLKLAINWAIMPNIDSCIRIYDAKAMILNGFPFNIAMSLYNTIDNATTTTSSNIAPLKWWNKDTHHYDTVGTLLSTSTLQTGMSGIMSDGSTLYDFYYLWAKRLIYLIGFAYLFFRIFKTLKPQQNTILYKRDLSDNNPNNYKFLDPQNKKY